MLSSCVPFSDGTCAVTVSDESWGDLEMNRGGSVTLNHRRAPGMEGSLGLTGEVWFTGKGEPSERTVNLKAKEKNRQRRKLANRSRKRNR